MCAKKIADNHSGSQHRRWKKLPCLHSFVCLLSKFTEYNFIGFHKISLIRALFTWGINAAILGAAVTLGIYTQIATTFLARQRFNRAANIVLLPLMTYEEMKGKIYSKVWVRVHVKLQWQPICESNKNRIVQWQDGLCVGKVTTYKLYFYQILTNLSSTNLIFSAWFQYSRKVP